MKISLFRKPQLLQGVYAMGFNRPSKIQENALPMMLAEPYVHVLPTLYQNRRIWKALCAAPEFWVGGGWWRNSQGMEKCHNVSVVINYVTGVWEVVAIFLFSLGGNNTKWRWNPGWVGVAEVLIFLSTTLSWNVWGTKTLGKKCEVGNCWDNHSSPSKSP